MKIKYFFIFFLIIFLIFVFPIFSGKFYSFRDVFTYFIPLKYFTVQNLKNLNFPFYNPYNAGGEYFLSNPQTGIFYPLTYLFLLPPQIAFQFYQFFQIFFCFLGVYLLSKSYGKDDIISISLGLSVIFSGIFLSLWDLPFEMGSISFLFLCLWALKEGREKLFLLFLSLNFFSGDPFSFFFSIILIFSFFLVEKIKFKLKPFLLFLIFSLGTFLLIFSTLKYTTRVERESLIFKGFSFKEILSLPAGTSSFLNFFTGEKKYSYLPIPFFGTFIFFSFLSGIFKLKKNYIYLILFLFFLFLSTGEDGIFKFIFEFPPFSFMRYPQRILPFCLFPMFLISLQIEKKALPFFLHLFFILLAFSFFPPKNPIFYTPLFSLFLILIIPFKSKFLMFIPFLDFFISFQFLIFEKFEIPPLNLNFKDLRVCIPEKNLIFFNFLYPNNVFSKESDLRAIRIFEGYTNLFYPVHTSFTPHPFPLKLQKDEKIFYPSCKIFGFIEKNEIFWEFLKNDPLIDKDIIWFKTKGDGFHFKIKLEEEREIKLNFLKLPYMKVYANKKRIEVDKEKIFISFKLKKGEYEIKITFTPLILKIFYFISFIAWIFFLCYLIIRWIFY